MDRADAGEAFTLESRDDADATEWYAISVDGEPQTWMLPLDHLASTGRRRSREDHYPS